MGGFTAPRVLPRAGGTVTAPPTSMGAAGAEQRFPIKAVYLAPALSTPKRAGLKVNSLSIPYCQLIHHPGRAGAARAPVGLGRVTKWSCVCHPPTPCLAAERRGRGPQVHGKGMENTGGAPAHSHSPPCTVLFLTAEFCPCWFPFPSLGFVSGDALRQAGCAGLSHAPAVPVYFNPIRA